LKDSPHPTLRLKAQRFAGEIRKAYPVFLAGRMLARGRGVRRNIALLEQRIHAALGDPTTAERTGSVLAVGLAAWTGLTLRLGLFQHPRLQRQTYRVPDESLPARVWRRLRGEHESGHRVQLELRAESTVWVTVAGSLNLEGAQKLATDLALGLRKRKERLVVDLERLVETESAALDELLERLRAYGDRVRILAPAV
jgi:hypothetical protein